MPSSRRQPPQDAPTHPGRFVRTAIIEPLGLSVKEAAHALGVHRVALSRLLNEQASLSSEMAVRLEKAFGANLDALMQMQTAFDIARARAHQGDIAVARYKPRPLTRAQPKLS